MDGALNRLLAQLRRGDSDAAGEVFLAFEPYLRKAVRRQLTAPLRSKFDSADVLQSVWVDVLRGFRESGWRFVDIDHLRGFLYVATRNRLIDRIRRYQRAADQEVPLGQQSQPAPQPRPSELAVASDLWERIVAHCPEEHRPILGLRRQGYSLAEIADRIGLHPDSIRRILRTLARQLAFEDRPRGISYETTK